MVAMPFKLSLEALQNCRRTPQVFCHFFFFQFKCYLLYQHGSDELHMCNPGLIWLLQEACLSFFLSRYLRLELICLLSPLRQCIHFYGITKWFKRHWFFPCSICFPNHAR